MGIGPAAMVAGLCAAVGVGVFGAGAASADTHTYSTQELCNLAQQQAVQQDRLDRDEIKSRQHDLNAQGKLGPRMPPGLAITDCTKSGNSWSFETEYVS